MERQKKKKINNAYQKELSLAQSLLISSTLSTQLVNKEKTKISNDNTHLLKSTPNKACNSPKPNTPTTSINTYFQTSTNKSNSIKKTSENNGIISCKKRSRKELNYESANKKSKRSSSSSSSSRSRSPIKKKIYYRLSSSSRSCSPSSRSGSSHPQTSGSRSRSKSSVSSRSASPEFRKIQQSIENNDSNMLYETHNQDSVSDIKVIFNLFINKFIFFNLYDHF